ncbi:MAG: hypothetical protein GQ534_03940 [Candidatus Delongbacteria bacterium]|nr:hypothetical protein [Candidatus Delongbacteria bacterium]
MNKLRYYFLIAMIILFLFNLKLNANDIKVSSERWFDWNGSAWVQTKWKNFEFDSLGTLEQIVDYYYNTEGNVTSTIPWNCTYYEDYYKIYRSYTWTGYKEGYTETYTYKYNLDGVITGSSFHWDYWSMNGGEYMHYDTEYFYSNDQLIKTETDYEGSYPDYDTNIYFTYEEHSRILSKTKQIYSNSQWLDKERTIWTYDGDVGTGVTEIYKNTVWIFTANKFRDINDSYLPITEERQFWSWGKFINSEKDFLYYDENPAKEATLPYQYLVDTQTYVYDEILETYVKDHRYYIYYDDFTSLVAPSNISSSIINDQIKLTWEAVSGADGYYVYSSTDPNGTFEIDTTGTFEGTQWTAPITEKKKFYKITSMKEDK